MTKALIIKAFVLVPGIGLEPIRPQWTQDFKSCVSICTSGSAVQRTPWRNQTFSIPKVINYKSFLKIRIASCSLKTITFPSFIA